MTDVISEYQKWKQQGEDLRIQARDAMATRFRELLAEAVRIAEEYRHDFGGPLKPPSPITAFRFKASARPKAKKGGKSKPAGKAPRPESRPEVRSPMAQSKITALQKRLVNTQKKLSDAKTAGTPTRALEDKIYEIEDAIRLAT